MKRILIVIFVFSAVFSVFAETKVNYVTGGAFTMGSDKETQPEAPTHIVEVDDFYMGVFEITNREALKVFSYGIDNGLIKADYYVISYYSGTRLALVNLRDEGSQLMFLGSELLVEPGRKDYPCVEISWYGAVVFCNLLSEMEGYECCYDLSTFQCDFTKNGYRLPTEAEWEYAAGGGINLDSFEFSGSDNADDVAWYRENSEEVIQPVGEKAPNSLGLYDMTGNVNEWCWDWYNDDYYSISPRKMPLGPEKGVVRVCRGGSSNITGSILHYSNRYAARPGSTNAFTGFRVVRGE